MHVLVVIVIQSAFPVACLWGLSDIHECSGGLYMALVGLEKQPPGWKPSRDWTVVLVIDLAIF